MSLFKKILATTAVTALWLTSLVYEYAQGEEDGRREMASLARGHVRSSMDPRLAPKAQTS